MPDNRSFEVVRKNGVVLLKFSLKLAEKQFECGKRSFIVFDTLLYGLFQKLRSEV